jgi:polyisoprenoid-binding protein YceI
VRVKQKRWLIAIPAAVLVVALGVGAYGLVTFLGHKAPAAFSLSTPAPSTALGGLAGSWKIAAGSEAGYRVREKFINQPAPTEAVARTSAISGSLLIDSQGAQFVVRQVSFSADVTKLHSVDTYATFQAFQRDNFVSGLYLQTGQYPAATFKADGIIPPAGASSSTTPVAMTGHGRLTLHGVSREVDVPFTIQLSGDRIELVGSLGLEMPEYGIEVPQIGFTRAEPHAIIEFHLFLTRG